MKENKKIITIIGSLTHSSYDITMLSNYLLDLGFTVHDPVTSNRQNKNMTLYDIQDFYISYIINADLVIAVPKPDGTFGESTSYELAIAKAFHKKVFLYTVNDCIIRKSYLKKEENKDENK